MQLEMHCRICSATPGCQDETLGSDRNLGQPADLGCSAKMNSLGALQAASADLDSDATKRASQLLQFCISVHTPSSASMKLRGGILQESNITPYDSKNTQARPHVS